MPNRSASPRPIRLDAVVYLATLAVGSVLILVGHLSPQDLAGCTTALASLYTAWRHHPPVGRPHRTRRSAPEQTERERP
ncbi:hypothetical protein [Streptacidiphilus neutrinimicus]|uniref:hypothetical protein n=1 Tax=Streptacidiphilus neutrinimicus TaxID=105420 RepID=UPI00126A1EED|nr:hypothetical protein [Streptacidiphilus neutrinimicus]